MANSKAAELAQIKSVTGAAREISSLVSGLDGGQLSATIGRRVAKTSVPTIFLCESCGRLADAQGSPVLVRDKTAKCEWTELQRTPRGNRRASCKNAMHKWAAVGKAQLESKGNG